jgi:hypothetical protein
LSPKDKQLPPLNCPVVYRSGAGGEHIQLAVESQQQEYGIQLSNRPADPTRPMARQQEQKHNEERMRQQQPPAVRLGPSPDDGYDRDNAEIAKQQPVDGSEGMSFGSSRLT